MIIKNIKSKLFIIMLLQAFIPQFLLALPVIEKAYERSDHVSSDENNDSDDEISLPSLDDLSIGTEYSEYTCSELSHVEMCHLLGPELPADSVKHILPDDLNKPTNLEHSVSYELPVGFRRLRRAILSNDNDFWDNKVLENTLAYKK